jgi:hypothetical protein
VLDLLASLRFLLTELSPSPTATERELFATALARPLLFEAATKPTRPPRRSREEFERFMGKIAGTA